MVKGIRLHCHCHWGLPLSSTTFVHTRVYQLQYILKYSIYIIQFSIFISVEWMWIMGSEYKFFKVVVCASSVWFDSILFNLYYTVHGQPAMILTFGFVAKWWNQRDGAPDYLHRAIEFRKNWSHVERTSDIFRWNLSTKNVDIYRRWYTLLHCCSKRDTIYTKNETIS